MFSGCPFARRLRMRAMLLAPLVLAALLPGCRTPDPGGAARDRQVAEGVERAASRLYKRPFDVIWEALLASAAERKLTVVQIDRPTGAIELRHGASVTSPGERIDIRVTSTIDTVVRVEIRSRALLFEAIAPDWQRTLFGDLEQKIAPRRPR